jgi:ketosteroid isomerase-like protein
MPRTPLDVVQEFLAKAFDPRKLPDAVTRLVAANATYVSLNFDNSELHRIMPWAGTKHGRQAFVENFSGVTRRWKNEAFRITDTVSESERVALFGSFSLRSVKLGKAATSAFAVFAKVGDDRIIYFQFMEDTFATARTFRSSGGWRIEADPDAAEPIEV